MSQFYDDAAALAIEQIGEFGRVITSARFTRTMDPVQGGPTSVTAIKADAKVVVLPVGKNEKLDNKLLEALTAGRLRKLIVAASGLAFEPEGNDWFSFDGQYWIARGSTPLNPAGTAILYMVIVERSALTAADIAALAT